MLLKDIAITDYFAKICQPLGVDFKRELNFYLKLVIAAKITAINHEGHNELIAEICKDKIVADFERFTSSSSLRTLITDYLTNESMQIKYYEHALRGTPLPKGYYDIFTHKNDVVDAIKEFTRTDHYAVALDHPNTPILDIYSDMWAFWKLSRSSQ